MASCTGDVPWKLYASRAISAWGDRMWMFAVGLFMVELSPESLKWPAIYGLTQSLSVVFSGSVIGRWVDQTRRWNAARISLAFQNVLVVVCAVCVALTFLFREELVGETWGLTGACSLIVILGTLANLASVAFSIVVYKDWVAVIAGGDSTKLARMNSTCRSIDLATNVIAPIAVGQIMYFLSHIVAAATIVGWNVVSFVVEFILLWRIYKEFSNLVANEKKPSSEKQLLKDSDGKENEDDANVKKSYCCFSNNFGGFITSWGIYLRHDVRNAGIGLACLYMTVLGFDSITTSYAYSQGVSESILGILQAAGAGIGLLGSVVFPSLVRYLGVERTGLYGFGLEVICLTLCVGSVWAPGTPFDATSVFTSGIRDPFTFHNNTNSTGSNYVDGPADSYMSVILLMSGIISARFGLWIADLSVNQVLQGVEDHIRGTINGVQSSMNMIFNTAKFLLVIACPWPKTFGFIVCVSFAFICAGWGFFASYSFKKRGHLLPFHKVINTIPPDEIHQINMEEGGNKKISEDNSATPRDVKLEDK